MLLILLLRKLLYTVVICCGTFVGVGGGGGIDEMNCESEFVVICNEEALRKFKVCGQTIQLCIKCAVKYLVAFPNDFEVIQ